jgi:uncharacterized protein YjbI with pentapeptide repeats
VWQPPLAVDRAWAELVEVSVPPHSDLDLGGVEELSVTDCILRGTTLSPDTERTIEIHRSALTDCDLSGVTIRSLQATRLTGCKLIGADLAGANLTDVTFERCLFRYANLRMAKLRRVGFEDCHLDEVDCYQLQAEHVAFPGSELDAVNLDQLRAERVDLRHAESLLPTTVNDLTGCLVAEHQLAGLAPSLAMAAGIDVERG